ncbi:MAG: TIGR03546 family protein, partial [Spirochaetaceae bacterium]|nr:TIGR03546 family protein [Spirochaetaceae bacterium]
PGEIAHAEALGLLLALVPRSNLLWVMLFSVTVFLRVNKGALFISLILLSFLVPFADVAIEGLGYLILSQPALVPFFTRLYETPFVPFTAFNNTMVAGGLTVGLLAYGPVFLAARILVKLYRKKVQPKIAQSRAFAVAMKTPFLGKLIRVIEIGDSLKG